MKCFEEVIGFEGFNIDGGGSISVSENLLKEMKEYFLKLVAEEKFEKDEIKETTEIFKQIKEDIEPKGYCTYLAY